ncbi:GC-rich sequence DNA-binding factor 2, partial [Dryobates pubescens]
GRRRKASSGSSSDEEPDQAAVPTSALGFSSDSEREAEPEEDEGNPGSATGSPESARATAAEGPLCPEDPAGSAEGKAISGIRPRDEEFFKIKKPSFNEVTFRIQKKESRLPSQTEAEESKKICQSEPRTVNTKGACKEDEEGDESYSSQSQDSSTSASENESSSLQRRKDLSPGNIPSTACIEAARRKRQLARTQADYLPLDVSDSHRVSQRRESSDLESEDESDTKNISFAPKMRTLRQRMAEHMGEFVPFLPVVV